VTVTVVPFSRITVSPAGIRVVVQSLTRVKVVDIATNLRFVARRQACPHKIASSLAELGW
jgi:hypothetical protein